MTIIVLIPTLICIVLLFRMSVQKVFVNLFLPVFIMLPTYYYWKVPSLPPIDVVEAILCPLGIAMFLKEARRWRFSVMDLWIALFIFCCFYASALKDQSTTWIFELFFSLCHVLVPYMIGKLLIEHNGMRIPTVKRVVFCLFIACIISAYEYRMGQNPFTLMTARYFPDEKFYWKTQIRWGFGRVSGPYGQSELGGIIFFFGLVLALWLSYYKLWSEKFRNLEWLPFRKSTVITSVIALTLVMSQARGPWLGAFVAIPIAMVGRARRSLRAAIIVGACMLVFGSIFYVALKKYSDASAATESVEQENAQYRAQLITNYLPIAEKGGLWGWGIEFPRAGTQDSVDDEFLFVSLVQGIVGLAAFSIITLGALYNCAMAAIFNPTKADRSFAFTMLGILVGMVITMFTVFLGNQTYEIFFLLAGWSQAIRVRPAREAQLAFQQVYT